MALIQWDDKKYSVSLNSIDEQHKKLVDLINNLHDAMMAGSSKQILKDIITELLKYTKYHFGLEEELMMKYNYTNYDSHKKIHENFIERIFDFQEKYLKGEMLLSIEIINFLRDWLLNHISGTDRQYTDLFIKNGEK